jgi:hypothetical protein
MLVSGTRQRYGCFRARETKEILMFTLLIIVVAAVGWYEARRWKRKYNDMFDTLIFTASNPKLLGQGKRK